MKLNRKKFTRILFLLGISIVLTIFILENIKKNKKINNKITSIETLYYSINLKRIILPASTYGGIDFVSNKIVYISNDLDFFTIDKTSYDIKNYTIKKFNNNKEFFLKKHREELGDQANLFFGIKDIFIGNFSNSKKKQILVSTLKYNIKDDCNTVTIFSSEIYNEEKMNLGPWNEIFSSKPCLKIDLTEPKFAAASAGGRIFKYDNENILLTIGDFYSDDVHGPALSQNLKVDYGKILKINLTNKNNEIFSSGHRNPQGLFISKDNNIFSSEHGPAGGDEVNLIYQNKNYGWPLNTFGVGYKSKKQYGEKKKNWTPDISNNQHDKFEKPIFSWGNTFAASNLIYYENDYFDKWKDNLLVGSLATKQISRLVFNKEKKSIILKEDIKLDIRIRDIIQLKDGKIIILSDPQDGFRELIIISKKI